MDQRGPGVNTHTLHSQQNRKTLVSSTQLHGVCSVGLMMCVTHAVCWFSVEEEWGLSDSAGDRP